MKNACDDRFGLGSNSEDLPIVLRLIEPASDSMGRSAVHEIVKAVMRETADRQRKQALEFAGMAAHIERASTRWLRRTAGLHQSDGIDLKIVRDTLGHVNIATNNIYLNSEDDAPHDATSAGHRVGRSARVSNSPQQPALKPTNDTYRSFDNALKLRDFFYSSATKCTKT